MILNLKIVIRSKVMHRILRLSLTKKGETTFEMKLKKGSFIIFVKITLNKNDNYCYARLSGRTYYPRFTITGRLYPLEDVGVFIGIDNR